MSTSFDTTFTNALERALAADEQLRDTLFGRSVAEAMRALFGSPTFLGSQGIGANDFDLFKMTSRTRVWGLDIGSITAGPRQLTINVGVVAANFGLEAPGVDDSTYRVGLNLVTTAVALPAADNLWHLLQCRIENTDVNEVRDILTVPVTRTYAPQSVLKRKLKRLVFQVITGTGSAIPAPTAGWVPLYGFVIPTTGTTLPVTGLVVDLRASSQVAFDRTENEEDGSSHGVTRVLSRRFAARSSITSPTNNFGTFDLTAIVDGVMLHAHTVDAETSLNALVAGGASPTLGVWHYVYLAPSPIGGQCGNALQAARNDPDEPIVSNCVVLISATAPRLDGRNSIALGCVAPFGGTNIAIGTAVCVAVLLRSTSGTSWEPITISADGQASIESPQTTHVVDPSTLGAVQVATVTTAQLLPINLVNQVDLQFGMKTKTPSQTAGGVNGLLLVTPTPEGAAIAADARTYGNILLNPLIQEAYQSLRAFLSSGFLVSSAGTLSFKIETRDATGIIIVLPNGLLTQVTNAGAQLKCRVVGFRLL
jgi:hypothetical protein